MNDSFSNNIVLSTDDISNTLSLEIKANKTAPAQQIVLTAKCSDDIVRIEYSLGNDLWVEYDREEGVLVTNNGTVYFRGFNDAGDQVQTAEYQVENIDKIAPEKPQITVSDTNPTNQDVIVSAVFSNDSTDRQYNKNNSGWVDYPAEGGITFEENGSVKFRSYDAAGNVSDEVEIFVNNIDKIAPEKPVISFSRENGISNESVTFIISASEGTLKYSFDNIEWKTYAEPVVVTENKTVYAKTTDAAGNSAETSQAITVIDPTAASSLTEYIFIKKNYTAKNTKGKKVNGIELEFGKNAFSSLEEAQNTLNDPANPLYVYVMLDSTGVLSGLWEEFTGQTVSGAQQKVTLEEDSDYHHYKVSVAGKGKLDAVSGDYSKVTARWFKNAEVSGRAKLAAAIGGKYTFEEKITKSVPNSDDFSQNSQTKTTRTASGKLTADSFAEITDIEYFDTVLLDNAKANRITGGKYSDQNKTKYTQKNGYLQKTITQSGNWSATGKLTLKNVAEVQNISNFKTLLLTNATANSIEGGSGKYSYKEKSTYKQEKITRTVTLKDTFASTGSLTGKGSILTDVYGILTVKLTDSKVNGTVQNADSSNVLNGSQTQKLTVSTAKDGSITGKYQVVTTFKRNGSFTATAQNDKMIVADIKFYNTVKLDGAVAGDITNLLQTKADEIYQQTWENAAECGVADDLALNIDLTKAVLLNARYDYSASGTATLKNNASAVNIADYKTVNVSDSAVTGDITLGNCGTIKSKIKVDSAGGKTETVTSTYKRSGSVKLVDSRVGGNVSGYNKVVLDGSTVAGNISQSSIVKEVKQKINGVDDVNNSFVTEKLSGSVTLKNNSSAGDITNYASVTLNGIAKNLANVNKVTVTKGYSEINQFTGTTGNDTVTLNKGSVLAVKEGMVFGAGNKDTLKINGTLVLYSENITGLEKISGSGEIAVTDDVAGKLDLNFENLLKLGSTVENFKGKDIEHADNTVKNAIVWDGAEEFNGWLGKAVDCEDTVDFIKFTTKEDCTLQITSTQWVGAVADIVAVNNVILKIADGFAETTLQANTEYTIKLERKESNSAAYTITLA